jgi:hypothetical protein
MTKKNVSTSVYFHKTLTSALLGNYANSLLELGRKDQALPLLRELKSIARSDDTDSHRVLTFLPVLEKESLRLANDSEL